MEDLDSLVAATATAQRILVVIGAGLSQPSGLPTFRQNPEFWGESIEKIASSAAFRSDPDRIWAQYERFRQLALSAQPNAGHQAISRLALSKPGLLAVTQNIDDLSERAGHPREQLVALHGSVFEAKCSGTDCAYETRNAAKESLAFVVEPAASIAWAHRLDRSSGRDSANWICPLCRSAKLRPGIVWFGEMLPADAVKRVEHWLEAQPYVDLVLVIGTQRTPYVQEALGLGARAAWFDVFDEADDIDPGDATWVVSGDASQTLALLVDRCLGDGTSH